MCNLWCKHCYQGERSSEELSLPEAKGIISEVSAMLQEWSKAYDVAFSPSFNITGGEPLLRRDLFDILGEINGNGFEIFLLTNGTLVDSVRSRMLAELGVKGVQVSIEGGEEVHDSIRGEGSFAASAAGIERLVDAGIPVTLNVTLSNLNARQMKKVIAFGSHVGARRIGFSRLVPYGRGRSLLPQALEPAQVRELYESLWSLEVNSLEIVTGDPLASQMKIRSNGDAGNIAVSGCAAGVSGLTILPNGNVTPCRRLPLSIGNVRRHSLRRIWATSPVLEALRDRSRYKGKCGACSRWAHCRGCRAIAYAFSRSRGYDDFLSDDPQCFLER
ncbi:MAG TPA: radical SAM protein [Nitrospirota bacterium]|nr:radical SAM protein [Nitrospirota bacterium]